MEPPIENILSSGRALKIWTDPIERISLDGDSMKLLELGKGNYTSVVTGTSTGIGASGLSRYAGRGRF